MLCPVNAQGFIDFNTAPFKYEIIVERLPKNRNGQQTMKPTGNTIHHSAVVNSPETPPLQIATAYANHHMNMNGGIAYTFGIYKFNDDNIYIQRYFPQVQWHNSNESLNKQTISTLVDGNYQVESPMDLVLKKLRFHLDVLSTNSFERNGWANTLNAINPRNPDQKLSGLGKTVSSLHWHDEAAINSARTACCGNTLKPYIEDYRNKRGDVDWGIWWKVEEPKPEPKPEPEKPQIPMVSIEVAEYDRLKADSTALKTTQDELISTKDKLRVVTQSYDNVVADLKKANDEKTDFLKSYDVLSYAELDKFTQEIQDRAIKAEELNKIYEGKIENLQKLIEANTSKPNNPFWGSFNELGRQIRYFFTNFFWLGVVSVIGVVLQFGFPESEATLWLNQNYPQIASVVLFFFSNSAVQAYFKDQQEKAKKQAEIQKVISE